MTIKVVTLVPRENYFIYTFGKNEFFPEKSKVVWWSKRFDGGNFVLDKFVGAKISFRVRISN